MAYCGNIRTHFESNEQPFDHRIVLVSWTIFAAIRRSLMEFLALVREESHRFCRHFTSNGVDNFFIGRRGGFLVQSPARNQLLPPSRFDIFQCSAQAERLAVDTPVHLWFEPFKS
ncbi:hypothetical protein PM082_019869 [Marasmius tenuissimus]|nr:hypothetical protein PM082_019869 [Marasmius tenuissimus]